MSVWYDSDCVIFGSRQDIADFWGLDLEDIRTEWFEINFGQKNGPGLNIYKKVRNSKVFCLEFHSVENSPLSADLYCGAQRKLLGIFDDFSSQFDGDFRIAINSLLPLMRPKNRKEFINQIRRYCLNDDTWPHLREILNADYKAVTYLSEEELSWY